MLFRSHKPTRIELDEDAISSDTPRMSSRLARIADHYDQLDYLLTDLEKRLPDLDSDKVKAEVVPGDLPGDSSTQFRPAQPR